jgi:hypothetical protein
MQRRRRCCNQRCSLALFRQGTACTALTPVVIVVSGCAYAHQRVAVRTFAAAAWPTPPRCSQWHRLSFKARYSHRR